MVLLVLGLVACGGRTRKPVMPDVPQSGNAEARSRFAEARTAFLRDGKSGEDFRQIVEEYPDDPIVPWAQLYAGIAAIKERKFEDAVAALESVLEATVPEALSARATMFLGIAKNYRGDAKGALPLLRRASGTYENEDEKTEHIAALAYATAVVEPPASLALFDQLSPRVNPTERVLLVARVEEVVAGLSDDIVRRAFDQLADRRGPALAVVASRLVVMAEQTGNVAEAQRMRAAAAPARQAVGLPQTIAIVGVGGSGGKAGLVGAVMPPGKSGDAAIAGLGLASGASGGGGVAAIEMRHAKDRDEAALAVEVLAKKDVIAVIGPIDSDSVDRAGARAEGLGVPMLSLTGRAEKTMSGRFVFHVRHSAEARARSLAKRALALGVKTFAVLSPEDNYGRSVGAAFADEVRKGGGSIVEQKSYPPDTKNFVPYAGKLGGKWQAVFVPEDARKLALIAPALSAKKMIPKPYTVTSARGGRPILLLSTAEELGGNFIADAARHSEGALLAPGFYPDPSDPAQKVFLDRFIASFGRVPGVLEAYAFDAAQLAAAAGTGGRASLAATLANGTTNGLTGAIKFDADHRRSDPGVLYTVVEDVGVYTIRVFK